MAIEPLAEATGLTPIFGLHLQGFRVENFMIFVSFCRIFNFPSWCLHVVFVVESFLFGCALLYGNVTFENMEFRGGYRIRAAASGFQN